MVALLMLPWRMCCLVPLGASDEKPWSCAIWVTTSETSTSLRERVLCERASRCIDSWQTTTSEMG